MRKTISLFTEFTIFAILIGSVAVGSMVFADEQYPNYQKEPIKHQKYDKDFSADDNISVNSKQHHPMAFEDMKVHKDETIQFNLIGYDNAGS